MVLELGVDLTTMVKSINVYKADQPQENPFATLTADDKKVGQIKGRTPDFESDTQG